MTHPVIRQFEADLIGAVRRSITAVLTRASAGEVITNDDVDFVYRQLMAAHDALKAEDERFGKLCDAVIQINAE